MVYVYGFVSNGGASFAKGAILSDVIRLTPASVLSANKTHQTNNPDQLRSSTIVSWVRSVFINIHINCSGCELCWLCINDEGQKKQMQIISNTLSSAVMKIMIIMRTAEHSVFQRMDHFTEALQWGKCNVFMLRTKILKSLLITHRVNPLTQ